MADSLYPVPIQTYTQPPVQSRRLLSETRKRPKYTRSKTGCLTCRVKKIKCDEAKPVCTRCTNASRDCTWPDDVPPRKKLAKDSTSAPSPASHSRFSGSSASSRDHTNSPQELDLLQTHHAASSKTDTPQLPRLHSCYVSPTEESSRYSPPSPHSYSPLPMIRPLPYDSHFVPSSLASYTYPSFAPPPVYPQHAVHNYERLPSLYPVRDNWHDMMPTHISGGCQPPVHYQA